MMHLDPSILRTKTCKEIIKVLIDAKNNLKENNKSKKTKDNIEYILKKMDADTLRNTWHVHKKVK